MRLAFALTLDWLIYYSDGRIFSPSQQLGTKCTAYNERQGKQDDGDRKTKNH